MGITYPAGVDTFPVPSLPETTSLSSAGTANRAHVDHHRDLGLGLSAVMANAALKTHTHNGTDGVKLLQVNTHESPDTDQTPASIHHTLDSVAGASGGLGDANKAAPGNHTHDYNNVRILNKPYLLCTSSTRPVSPYVGLTIYETNTNRLRTWCQLPDAVSPSWRLMPGSPVLPICRLRQATAQQLAAAGSIVNWDTVVEDNFGYWGGSGNKTAIIVTEPGLYQIEAALQWTQHDFVPDTGTIVLCINGVETTVRNAMPMRGNAFIPDFSQTLAVSGKIRLAAGDVLSAKVKYKQPGGFFGFILSFFDGPNKIQSRIDIVFVGC